mmetsp:Transcript_21852/g.62188  ORF Transcript_21852/g.62188 Transcript_21852/m.62188 type:complete len:208 (-) Transcript_21852:1120-1743(-)
MLSSHSSPLSSSSRGTPGRFCPPILPGRMKKPSTAFMMGLALSVNRPRMPPLSSQGLFMRTLGKRRNGVPSCLGVPCMAATLPATLSMSMPMVMREGKPWGLNRMSGTRPDSVNGMSSCGHSRLRMPFCPCRDENLSPTMGLRLHRSLSSTLSATCEVCLRYAATSGGLMRLVDALHEGVLLVVVVGRLGHTMESLSAQSGRGVSLR